MMTTFDTTFHEAIQQIVQWGGVVTGEDTEFVLAPDPGSWLKANDKFRGKKYLVSL